MKRVFHSMALTLATLAMVSMLAGCSSNPDPSKTRAEDATINSTVKNRLATEAPVSLSTVGVDTANNTVYLSGSVPTFEQKMRAEAIARETPGVNYVVNKIHVFPGPDNPQLASTIRSRYTMEPAYDWSHVTIDIRGNTVYLYGVVPTVEQKMRAEMLAREVKGVDYVVNDIHVIHGPNPPLTIPPQVMRPSGEDPAITAAIRERMMMDRMANLSTVNVNTAGGTVYLNGIVPTPQQKLRAEQIAWEVRGVNRVVNNLEVQGY